MTELLPIEHRILERPKMLFRPFGKETTGETIGDLMGFSIRANVEFLEEEIGRVHGLEGGKRAVEELVTRLNERIPDRAYHVSSNFLKNPWTGYSNEFVAYLVELCIDISGDMEFQLNMGRKKLISPIIQTLMRPFSIQQIYKMAAYWVQHYNKNSYHLKNILTRDHSVVVRMMLTERALQHFGPYRKACGKIWCNAIKIGIAAVPPMVHNFPEATVNDLKCIAEGDEFCEWEITWTKEKTHTRWRKFVKSCARRILLNEIAERERVIQEQLRSLETRHEELHGAYLEQQQSATELQRRVAQLTTLHEASLAFTSTLDPEILLKTSMETMIKKLPYDRAIISFFDNDRALAHSARIVGVTPELEKLVNSLKIPITDPNSIEGRVLLRGQPILIGNLDEVWDQIHPLNQDLALRLHSKAFISVPLKVKDRIIGSLSVDRTQSWVVTQEDLEVIVTVGNQLAMSLDNAKAYQQIEDFNLDLEKKVQKRTSELEFANEKLMELDRLKSDFVSIASHELRTPLTSIKGLVENMLEGVPGSLNPRQSMYLERVKDNIERLTRMSNDLLDLASIEANRMELRVQTVSIVDLVAEVTENLGQAAQKKSLTLESRHKNTLPPVIGDRDKLHQVLTNLVYNAIKFTPIGGNINVETMVNTDGIIKVSINDTGYGISLKEQSKVFNRFYKGESSSVGTKGAGLGLAITKSLVELHGGTIGVESTLGQGSQFWFTLPVQSSQTPDE